MREIRVSGLAMQPSFHAISVQHVTRFVWTQQNALEAERIIGRYPLGR
jgi:hypothetical protein